jgi:hypothetical protein
MVNPGTLLYDWGFAGGYRVSANQAYAVTRIDSPLGRYTAAHEVSHLFGCRHENDATTLPYLYQHAWRKPTGGRKVTVDGNSLYPNERIMYWSNPAIQVDGDYIGNNTWSNTAQIVRDRIGAVSTFRGDYIIMSFATTKCARCQTASYWINVECGDVSSYQWYYMKGRQSTWSNGGTGSSFSTIANNTYGDIYVKCIFVVQGKAYTYSFTTIISGGSTPCPEATTSSEHDESTSNSGSRIRIEYLFPTPTNDVLNVGIESLNIQELHLKITSIDGCQQYGEYINKQLKGQKNLALDISSLPTGNYILEIQDNFGIGCTSAFQVIK